MGGPGDAQLTPELASLPTVANDGLISVFEKVNRERGKKYQEIEKLRHRPSGSNNWRFACASPLPTAGVHPPFWIRLDPKDSSDPSPPLNRTYPQSINLTDLAKKNYNESMTKYLIQINIRPRPKIRRCWPGLFCHQQKT